MMLLLIFLGSFAALLFAALATRSFISIMNDRSRAVGAAEIGRGAVDRSTLDALDAHLVRTRVGRWLTRQLDLAGLTHRPVVVFAGGIVTTVVATSLIWRLVAPLLAVLGLIIGVIAVRRYFARAQARRREAFVAQLPELARVLANASHAGLSLPTAVAIAGDELPEPAHSELSRVATRLSFGAPLPTALQELNERIGSRETNVLMSTLIVASRSGGSLVSALRDIAIALDQRKETRREVQTTLSQAIASSNLVIIMGFVMLLMVNGVEPGTVDRMTREPLGQLALVVGGGLFIGGYAVIRRMSRIEP